MAGSSPTEHPSPSGTSDADEVLLSFRELFDRVPGFVWATRGPDHVFELVNQSAYALVCHRAIVGMPIRQALPEAFELASMMDGVYSSGQVASKRAHLVKLQPHPGAARSNAFVDFVCQPIFDANGEINGLISFGHDVTDEVQARIALQESEQRFQLALEAAGDGVWDWSVLENRFLFSKRGREMLGYAAHEVGTRLEDWLSITHVEDQERVKAIAMACLKGRIPFFSAEYRVRSKSGEWKWILSRGAVVQRDENGMALRLVGTTTDVSVEQETLRRANFDSLTRLPNRNLFRDRLAKEVQSSRRSGKALALMFLDLDHFKEVNDLLGHDAGDRLLRQCADRICSCVRAADTVARLGGDEFTVILPDLESRAHVEDVAQKILQALSQPFDLGSERVHVSASIGITLHPDDDLDPERLVQNADQAMYVAKNAGRKQFHFFTRCMQERASHRLRLIGELRDAIQREELRLHFQPVVELASGKVTKGEALLRWQHPRLGLLPPSEFISLAEESGLIHEIGHWAFTQSCRWCRQWNEQTGAGFQVSVNVSPLQFMKRPSAIDWGGYVKELGGVSNGISVEITEGTLFNTSASTEEQLLAMRDAGIQVAIDDFGTGYSSMSYLKKFNVDYLKIDQSFIRGTAPRNVSRTIAETIIVMAHKLGLEAIAEGIETREQLKWLQLAGCDFGQGFLFSEPVPPEEFGQFLRH